jgi:hypothetical protein
MHEPTCTRCEFRAAKHAAHMLHATCYMLHATWIIVIGSAAGQHSKCPCRLLVIGSDSGPQGGGTCRRTEPGGVLFKAGGPSEDTNGDTLAPPKAPFGRSLDPAIRPEGYGRKHAQQVKQGKVNRRTSPATVSGLDSNRSVLRSMSSKNLQRRARIWWQVPHRP